MSVSKVALSKLRGSDEINGVGDWSDAVAVCHSNDRAAIKVSRYNPPSHRRFCALAAKGLLRT